MNLEKGIIDAVAKMLTVGFEYQTEYGTQTKEAALTPIIKQWVRDNQQSIIEKVIDKIDKEAVKERVVEEIIKHISSNNWGSYTWKDFIKETSPIIAEKVAQKMYEEHKKEICK